MDVKELTLTADVEGRTFTFRTGKLAGQAGGAVSIQIGETVVLATATASKDAREGIDFFPLSVDLEEKLYAAGRIPGSFFRREGRPSEVAILTARLIDRPLRPLFSKSFRNDVQIIITALASDSVNFIDIPSLIAASSALMISDIPFPEPVAGVRVGMVDGAFVVNPTADEMATSTLDLRVAGTEGAILMVECGASEIDEDTLIRALKHGHAAMQPLLAVQRQLQAAVGKTKRAFVAAVEHEALTAGVRAFVGGQIDQIFTDSADKHARMDALEALGKAWFEHQTAQVQASVAAAAHNGDPAAKPAYSPKEIKAAYDALLKERMRQRILTEGIRPDGRRPGEIRPLFTEVGLLPRVHGSAIFQRGETQVMTITTLGTLDEEQRLDTLRPEGTKRYMHHYNFPPFSTGEAYPLRGPKRREIGHGALAETALRAVVPSPEDFPYALRLVSECLSSNGSTSMAAVCASTLSLMDAGVPISAPVAGIAMGLVTDDRSERFAVLTDIQGMEDALGDMDFKVAGTAKGVTALQMDIKLGGLSETVLRQSLDQARAARLQLLDCMATTIAAPRPEMSQYAPRITTLHIDPELIGKLIGPGGKTIRALQEKANVKINVQDDGTVHIAAIEGSGADLARDMIEALTASPELGKVYSGTVVRTTDFGAFIEILPGIDGLVHISQLAAERVNSVEDVVQVGDEVLVMVTDISNGKVRLSRQAVLEGWSIEEARAADPGVGGGGGGRGGGRPGGDRDRDRGGDRGGRGGGGGGGYGGRR